jgi:putative SOS response-associated peptidase YedK
MCSHYERIADPSLFRQSFGVEPAQGVSRTDIWPGYESTFIRSSERTEAGGDALPSREAVRGLFGLVPHWASDLKIARRTYNARSETAAEKPSFRDAWRRGRHCIVPAAAIYEPDWRSGKAVPARISRANSQPMGLAGLWSSWKGPQGDLIYSFTILTINAQAHSLMRLFHNSNDEKRMVVVLAEDQYDAWLRAEPDASMDFMQPYPAVNLKAQTAPQAQSLASTVNIGLW